MSRTRTWALVSAIAFLLSGEVQAQCNFDQTFTDRGFVLDGVTDTLRAPDLFAYWAFQTVSDSAETEYLITEFKKNGTRLILQKWCRGQEFLNWSDAQLADSSRTTDFKVQAGDTLSFFRQFMWFKGDTVGESFFHSRDTLDYAVELVRKSTGARYALIDSIGVLKRSTRGNPTLYGASPRMARVSYVVPSDLNNDTVFLRVRPTMRGNGLYNQRRRDKAGALLSSRLNDTLWQSYASGLWKRDAREFDNFESTVDYLSVGPNPAGTTFRVMFKGTEERVSTTILLYDVNGTLVKSPYTSVLAGRDEIEVSVESPGTYYVVLMHGREVVAVNKISSAD